VVLLRLENLRPMKSSPGNTQGGVADVTNKY
jgi:hypothetical protein